MKKWLENYWYHYKWVTIIVAFFIIVAVICSIQLFTRENYDSHVTFIGNGGSITQTQYYDVLNALKGISDDYNKDGETIVCFSRETFIADAEDDFSATLNSNVTSFMQSCLYNDSYLLIIDPVLYESYKASGMFVTLSSHVKNIPEQMINDEYSIKLSETAFYNLPGINCFSDDMLIVLKTVPYFSSKRKMEAFKITQSYHADMLQNIIDMGVNTGTNE